MKIAICLSGHFRSYERCFETLNNTILKNYNPDIFIFTWDNLGFDGVRGDYNLGNINKHLDKINKLYNPKTICIEPMKKWNTHKYNKIGSGLRNPEILFGMFYGIYKSNELRKNYENINKFK